MSKQKIIDQINKDLQSTEEKVVINALTTARQKGNSANTINIVKLLGHESPEIREATKKLLFDLKDSKSVPVLLDCFNEIKDTAIRNIILQSLWQSNIQPVNELSRLVRIAVKGTLEEAIEIYSIVTNMIDVVIPDGEIMESLLLINNEVENIRDKPQKQLVRDIATFLEEEQNK